LDRFVVQGQRTPTRGDYAFVAALLLVLAAAAALPIIVLVLLVRYFS
ncbi:MAG: hypothetical protein H6Q10_2780, partial [Acidobacteria bacterium]|nr:hypothetical protein [Acidobacteriota bacterium]